MAQAGGDRVVEALPFNGIILSDNAAPNRERNRPGGVGGVKIRKMKRRGAAESRVVHSM